MTANHSFLVALRAKPDLNAAMQILDAAAHTISAANGQQGRCPHCRKSHWIPRPSSSSEIPSRSISWVRSCRI